MAVETSMDRFGKFTSEFALGDAPGHVIEECKKQVLDAITGVFAASHYPGGQIPAKVAQALDVPGAGKEGTATIFSTGKPASAVNAAFANAQCSIAMDVASNLFFSQGLPGVTVFPALAIAERDHLSGTALLEALIPAYEVVGRVALSFPAHWRPPSVVAQAIIDGIPEPPYFGFRWIGFGSATSAAKILGLTASQTAHALSLAACALPIPRAEGVTQSMGKYGLLGMIAWSGMVSSELAANGFTGDIDQLDHGRFHKMVGSYMESHDALAAGLGETWLITEANYKRYPVGTHNNQGLYTVEQIMRDEDLTPADVESVSYERAIGLGGGFAAPRPRNYIETEFSLPFQTAAVIHNRPHKEWGEAFADSELLKLADRVSLEGSPRVMSEFEQEWSKAPVRSPWWFRTMVTVNAGGRTIERWSDYGKPSNDELAQKFRHWSAGVLTPEAIDATVEMVLNLENLDDVGELTRSLADRI